jgi:hypothetical protein|tara:strand:+ start:9758 stop:12619 length:2862 start_codon:yes stop_codon:yes gene_type:complete
MLTNQDRRSILEQVKSSGSGDIMAALQGNPTMPEQPQQEMQQAQPEPPSIPPSSPEPVTNVDMQTPEIGTNSLVNSFSNTAPQIQDLPNGSAEPQLLKTGGVKSHGGLHTAEASSTAVAPVNIPTIIEPETEQEKMIRLAAQKNTGTIYDPLIGNNPNKQWISGASNQNNQSNTVKQNSQNYGETILSLATPIPLVNSMKVTSAGARIPGLLDDVILGSAGKVMSKAGNTTVGTAIKNKVADMSVFSKEMLKDMLPNSSNFSKVKVVNPTSKGAAGNLIKTKEGQKAFLKEFEDGAVSIEKIRDAYSQNIASKEGQKRLLNQEIDYLRKIGYGNGDEAIIKSQAKINAEAKELEVILTTNRNAEIAGGVFGENKTIENIANDSYHFNNAVYRKGPTNYDDLFLKNGDPVLDTSSPFNFAKPTIKGGKVNPGSVTLGNKYTGTSGNRVAAHEFGHVFQGGRQLAMDERLIKGIKPSSNLSPENKSAYNYFKKSGQEPSAYIHGLRQQMLDDKLINNYYQNISPELLDRAKTIYKVRPSGVLNPMEESYSSNTRILNFMDNTKKNFTLLSNEMNKLPAIMPVMGVGAGVYSNQKKLGGFDDDPQERLELDYTKPPTKPTKKATTGKETSYRQSMMHFLHDTNKVDTNYVNNVMQVVAEHESKNVDDAIQVSGNKETGFYDGPARGAYQYEIGSKQGGSTAMNRNASFTRDSTNRSFSNFPTVYTEGKKESPDFSTLSREDQDGLFLGDKMNKNTSSSKAFYDLVKNDDTSPTSDEIFEFWGKNHKRVFTYKIQTKGGEETVKYTYDNLPDDKKALELKKWRANTKKKFRKGGISGYTTKAYEKVNDGISDNRLEQIGSDASEYFNAYTNPTLINNKNLNLQANMGIDSEVGWNANNTKFSKYGSPTVNLGGSFGLSGKYTKNNFTANAGVNYQTGSRPSYNAGLSYNFKKGGYKH